MPDFGSPVTVFLRAPGNISLSAIRQRFPSITFTSRRRSSRGDDNLEQAEYFLQVTEKQLNTIYKASRHWANETLAAEIIQIEDRLKAINSTFETVKNARDNQSTIGQILQSLGNDAATKDVLEAARELSKKAKRTSARVLVSTASTASTLQTVPSSEYPEAPNNEMMTQTNLSGISISFNRQPDASDVRKIDSIIHLFDSNSDDSSMEDSMEEPESVRGLRSKKSDLSTYSFHFWGQDAYKTEESRPPSDVAGSQSPFQSKTSIGITLAHTTFNNCNVNVLNIQPNDGSTVSDAISNLGVSCAGRDLPVTPPLLAVHECPCPSCHGSRGVEVMQTSDTSPKDAAIDVAQSASERHSLATLSSQSQNSILANVPISGTHPDEADIRQASPLTTGAENINSHCMIVNGPATVLSPTMNIQSPGSTGATNTYSGGQPAHCPSPQASAQSRDLGGPRFGCKEFSDSSVSYNPTSDES